MNTRSEVAGSKIRVLLPMITLVPEEMGGSETYARELLRAMSLRSDVEATIVVTSEGAGFGDQWGDERVLHKFKGGGTSVQRASTAIRGIMHPHRRRLLAGADLVHYPFSVPVPYPTRAVPFVQSLLDTQHLDLPELFSFSERAYRRVMYDRTARHADAVITISEFSKRQAVRHLGLDPLRVHVAHLGVRRHSDRPRVPRAGFVLYPARAWPHKNHSRLIDAMELLRRDHPELRLVLTGGALETLGQLPEWVEKRGHVSEQELVDLYRTASCLAFPSLYEGFGMPPLEAMSLGCPVASSHAGALPEVCGDAAVLFDPYDPHDIARGIREAITSGERIRTAGYEQARLFTWDGCAAAHLVAYRQLVAHT